MSHVVLLRGVNVGGHRTFPARDTTFERCLVENGIPTVAIFLREAWQTVGGYRDWGLGEDYVYEDWDFWARLLGHGFRAKSLLEPLMHYRVHTKGLSDQGESSARQNAQD